MTYSKMRRRMRIRAEKLHKDRILSVINYCGYPGPYQKDSGAVIKSTRGSISKFLKRRSNRAVRRSYPSAKDDVLPRGRGIYRRCFDYWRELT